MTRVSRRITWFPLFLLLLLGVSIRSATAESRPNVLIIMVDDMGFSDLGCYGSEIETPHLDALAANGLRFSQFYNTAKCHSSRVSLLTGQYCIAAGDTALTHAVTSAEVLSRGGYFTAMTGKWHLKQQPTDFGFDRYFGHLSGACNYFTGDQSFRLNGEPWKVPEDGFYTTVANVDYALRFLQEARREQKPWYLYIAFNAPHAPLHALPDDYAKYQGRYEEGWDVVRSARVEKQKALQLLPANTKASPRPEHVPAWNTMPPWRQQYESNRMTTLAAMIDRVDQEVGRLIQDLKSNGELDNTFLLFVSDNGACPYDRKPPLLDVEPTDAQTSLADSTGWAWARNSPFRYYKQNQFEGGIASPAIVHWPAGLKADRGSIVRDPAHLIDVLPTLAQITGSEIPKEWTGRELRPVSGISLHPVLEGRPLGSRPPIHFLFSTDRGLRDGDWKLVSFRQEAWELYHLADDRTERNDLASAQPERLQAMIETWTEMTRNVLHAPPRSYEPTRAARLPHRHHEWTDFSKSDSTSRSARRPNRSGSLAIRARKSTQLTIADNVLELQFTGDDPGIAMDLRGQTLPKGPYRLSFRLMGGSPGGGEIFFTTDPKVTLPNGTQLKFPVHADQQWHDVTLPLSTDQTIQQLRIDVSDGPGDAKIADLKLLDREGTPLITWPQQAQAKPKQ